MSKCPRCASYLVESFIIKDHPSRPSCLKNIVFFASVNTWGCFICPIRCHHEDTNIFSSEGGQSRHQLIRGTPRKTNGWSRENHLFGRENHLKQTFGIWGFNHQLAATFFHWNPHQTGDWCWIIMNDCKFWWFWPQSSPDCFSEIRHLWDSDYMMNLCVARFLVCFILDHCLHPVIWHHMAPILYLFFELSYPFQQEIYTLSGR